MATSADLTMREFNVLRHAVVFGWDIETDGYGRLLWDSDYLMPFRAKATLDKLVAKGLMELVLGREYRATTEAHDYKCSCIAGKIYETDTSDKIIDCQKCEGKGLLRRPRAVVANQAPTSKSSTRAAKRAKRRAEGWP